MTIHIFCTPNNRNKTIKKLNQLNLFLDIIKTQEPNMLLLKTKKPLYSNNTVTISKLTKTLTDVNTIRSIIILPLKTKTATNTPKKRRPRTGKLRYIFFDIDSTLTHTGVSSLNKSIKSVFDDFLGQNCSIFFCTGRSSQDVKKLIKQYKTSPYGIAENGGIIINSSLPNEKFGDRYDPDKLLTYLSDNQIDYKLDDNQQNRKTENILVKNSISPRTLSKSIKNSKLCVEFHTSKNTHHISKKGINKGTAIEYMTSQDELGLSSDHETIAVGDSDLDMPMFDFCDISYAVADADKTVQTKANYVLKSKAPYAIKELYDKLFAYA